MENKFKVGDFVHSIATPELKLVVRRYVGRIYYCMEKEGSRNTDLIYFERELLSDAPIL
jgi:hypothetical protein